MDFNFCWIPAFAGMTKKYKIIYKNQPLPPTSPLSKKGLPKTYFSLYI
jgi:hypothetical protein